MRYSFLVFYLVCRANKDEHRVIVSQALKLPAFGSEVGHLVWCFLDIDMEADSQLQGMPHGKVLGAWDESQRS